VSPRRISITLVAAVALGALPAAGQGHVHRIQGGPLARPAGSGSSQASMVPEPGHAVAAGLAVLYNLGRAPAVIERVRLLHRTRGMRLIGVFAAGRPRANLAGNYDWPLRHGDFPSVRRAAGARVLVASDPERDIGTELLVALRFPHTGRFEYRGLRVYYRYRGRHYVTDAAVPYRFCVARHPGRCPAPRPYDPKRDG
jgi:hypothetical protein